MAMLNTSSDNFFVNGCGRCEKYATEACKVHHWESELALMRSLLIESELKEDCKWGSPCYTLKGKNVILLTAFKNDCRLTFFKGALMDDPYKLLEDIGQNTEQAKTWRFSSSKEIQENSVYIKSLIQEAVRIEREGITVSIPKKELDFPEELLIEFNKNPVFEEAFKSLTPGRQKGYLLHFSQAKQSSTRSKRIEKHYKNILEGKGMHDDYKKKI